MKFGVGKKLSALLLFLLGAGILGATLLSTELFTSDLTGFLRKNTLDSSKLLAGRLRSELKFITERMQLLGAVSLEDFHYPKDRERFVEEHFSRDSRFIALSHFVLSKAKPGADRPAPVVQWRVLSRKYKNMEGFDRKIIEAFDERFQIDLQYLKNGELEFWAFELQGLKALRIAIPLARDSSGELSQYLTLDVDQEQLSSLLAGSLNTTSYLLDRKGQVLGTTDPAAIPLGTRLDQLSIVKTALQNSSTTTQAEFVDASGVLQMGAYQNLGFAGLSVISQIPFSRALEAQKLLFRRMSLLSGAFLFLALTFGIVFSRGITARLESVSAAAKRVRERDLTVRLPTPRKPGFWRDEIDDFKQVFNQMVEGLEEHQHMRLLFDKFHHKKFTENLLRDHAKLGGEKYQAAVLFADVRGFTELGENLEPQKLVHILNRYMSKMVGIILKHDGIVDKFVGDAIVAVWGVPEVDPAAPDHALRACLEMRKELAHLNAAFQAEGLLPLRIGMGLHYGSVVAGNIGSPERMEFTVIGDTVNTSSRLQELTKLIETDLLVSAALHDSLTEKCDAFPIEGIVLRGKKEAITAYRINEKILRKTG